MLRNKFKAAVIIALLSVSAVSAADKSKVKEPKKGHVLVVGKVTYKKPIDIAGREKAFRAYAGSEKHMGANDNWMSPDFEKKIFDTSTGSVDGYFFQEIKPGKDGKLHLKAIRVGLFSKSSGWFTFNLPAEMTITVPDEAVYAYMGTLEYDLDYALRMNGFRQLDEFEEAKKVLNREIGKNVELYRAPVTLDADAKENSKK